MKPRNAVAAMLTVGSFGLLVPGLVLPLITINASVRFLGNSIELFNETRSIVQTIRNLHESGNNFVAGLIFFFGIVVPFLKGALLGLSLLLRRNARLRWRLFAFVRSISKWAMADVFVVGVYVAFLSAKAADNLDATIRPGFYWFAAYCLVSLLALQLMRIDSPAEIAGSGG